VAADGSASLRPAPWWRSSSRGRDALLLVLVTAAVYLLTGDHIPLGSSTRYYEAAREMRELDDWTVPHLAYAPYLEKPPLVYWLGAAARSLGDGWLALSLPSGLAVLAMVLATWALGRAWRGPGIGLGAALLLIGTSFTQFIASVLTTDPLVAGCVAVAWWTWWEWERDGRRCFRWLLAFYLAIAIGWLAKGPIALALPGAGIGLYALLAGGLAGVGTTLWAMRPWWGLALIVAVNLPWTLAVWARDPRLIEFFYLRINLDAFASGSYNHAEPWHFYLPTLLALLVPYTLVFLPLLLAALWRTLAGVRLRGLGATPPADPGRLYLACAFLGPFLLLSASSAKLGTYLLPLLPPALLLVVDALAGWTRAPRWVAVVFALQAVLLALALALLWPFAARIHAALAAHGPLVIAGTELADHPALAAIDWDYLPVIAIALVAALLGQLAALVALLRQRLGPALAALGIGLACAAAIVLPWLDALLPNQNADRLVRAIAAAGGDDQALAPELRDPVVIHQSVVHSYELLFALRRRAAILDGARETGLGHFLQAAAPGSPMPGPGQPIDHPYEVSGDNTTHPWLWSRERFKREWAGPRRVWLLTRMPAPRWLAEAGLPLHEVARARKTLLLCNQAPSPPP
jgi:4-amino-4-deoxy-L-arabinose transferase-like glycosyltransferase